MLSAQTKDEMVAETMGKLKEYGLSIQIINKMSEKEVNELIARVGFHNKKAQYIKKTTRIIADKYDGIVPQDIEDITDFPGVGPKMGIILLDAAFGKTVGISVDTHVHRISNRLGWVSNTKTPDATMKELESWVPKDKWSELNKLLVGYG